MVKIALEGPATRLVAGRIKSPIGAMAAIIDGLRRLVYLDFRGADGPTPVPQGQSWCDRSISWDDDAVTFVRRQIADYFGGRLSAFDLDLAPAGNPFHQEVWAELRRIPYGETISYGTLAGRVGRPGAARAVGRANGSNPIAIVVPCHRVIGVDGRLTGYSGGIERKAALLALERAATPSGQGLLPLDVTSQPRRHIG